MKEGLARRPEGESQMKEMVTQMAQMTQIIC